MEMKTFLQIAIGALFASLNPAFDKTYKLTPGQKPRRKSIPETQTRSLTF